jgi:hypothetical protein
MRHHEHPSLSQRAAPALLAVLPVASLALAGCLGTAPGRATDPSASHSVASEPGLSRTERTYIGAAWDAAVARDHACRGFAGARLTVGSPSPALTSRFAILRSAPTPAPRLRSLLHTSGGFWSAGAQLYVNQIHRVRSAFGATFYVIPAGNVSGQRGVPARCGPEQIAALKHRLARVPRGQRTQILAAQTRYLAYLHYLAENGEGVCATFMLTRGVRPELGDNAGCATRADFARWGVLADTQAYLGGTLAAFWTVVPDGVATVTLRFGAGRHTIATSVRAVNNVVVAREPYKALAQSGFPSMIVLRGVDGRPIRTIAVTPNMPTLCGYGC